MSIPDEYAEEVEARWGGSAALAESLRKTATYGKPDWLAIESEAAAIVERFADLLRAGAPADGEAATSAAEEHRRHITRWFYDCPPEMHVGVAEMYTDDPRFSAYYDRHEPGLARFVRTAVEANAAARR